MDKFRKGEYEHIPNLLNEDVDYAPAMILRAKFLSYGVDVNAGTRYFQKVKPALLSAIENEENPERKRLLQEALDILQIELMYTMVDVDKLHQ